MATRVAIGYGNAARLHQLTYPEVETIGVVDIDPAKREKAEGLGLPAYKTIDEVISERIQPTYFDIMTPTDLHFHDTAKILSAYSRANLLIEKPVCLPSQIQDMRKLTKNTKAKITVNENYNSSIVTSLVGNYVKNYGLETPEISIEFTKNRIPDVERGRFIDEELGAWGYEGPHMITNIITLGEDKRIKTINSSELRDMVLSDGRTVENQGEAQIHYEAIDDSQVHLFTSMMGNRNLELPTEILQSVPKYDTKGKDRFRAIHIRKEPIDIIGIYEPMPGHPRNNALVLVLENNKLDQCHHIFDDNTMRHHQMRAVEFFECREENPCDVETSITILEDLEKIVKHAKNI